MKTMDSPEAVPEIRPEIPEVPSPYAGRKLSFADHLSISSFWFSTNFLWGAMLILMLPSQVKLLAKAYHQDHHELLGYTVGLTAIVALLVPLFTGPLSDRCASAWGRRRPFIAFGIVAQGLSLLGMMAGVLILNLPLFFLSLVFLQFGNNVATGAYSGVIPDLVPEDQRGTASGFMAIMTQLGTLSGVVIVGALLGGAPVTLQYLVLIGVTTAVAMITLVGLKETPLPYAPPRLEWGPYLRSLADPLKSRDFLWVWITRALVMLGFYSVQPFVQYYLADVIRLPDAEKKTPIVLLLVLVGALASGYLGGVISDKVGRKRVVYASTMIIAVMAIGLAFCRTLPQVVAVAMLLGVGYGAYISVDWALGTDVLPSHTDAAKDMAVWHISMTLPMSIGPLVAGRLLFLFGAASAAEGAVRASDSAYMALFVFAAFCFLLGGVLLRNVKGST